MLSAGKQGLMFALKTGLVDVRDTNLRRNARDTGKTVLLLLKNGNQIEVIEDNMKWTLIIVFVFRVPVSWKVRGD